MQMDVLALIATIIFILIAAFLIPVLLQIKQTVQRLDGLIGEAERDVLPLMRDVRDILEHVKKLAAEAERDVSKIRPIFDSLEETGTLVHNVTSALNSGVGRALANSVGTWMGMRSAKKAFTRELKESKRR